jgi:PilZ domain
MGDVKAGSATAESTRLDPRYPAATVSGITGMRLSPGDVVSLVNISASGVLVEGKTRFVPGTRLTVIFEGPKAPDSVKGRIVRCQVSSIGGRGSLHYQSAIALETRIEVPIDEEATAASSVEATPSAPPKETGTSPSARPPIRNRW